MAAIRTARSLFEHYLRDAYAAEEKLAGALRSMTAQVDDGRLAGMLREHARMAEERLARLETVFPMVGAEPRGEICRGIEGLVEEYVAFARDRRTSRQVLDVFTAGAAAKMERYAIGACASLIRVGHRIGLGRGVGILQRSLREGADAAQRLEQVTDELARRLDPGTIFLSEEDLTRRWEVTAELRALASEEERGTP